MIGVAIIALLLTMGLALIRAFKGPSVYDRMLAVNMFGTKTVLLGMATTYDKLIPSSFIFFILSKTELH